MSSGASSIALSGLSEGRSRMFGLDRQPDAQEAEEFGAPRALQDAKRRKKASRGSDVDLDDFGSDPERDQEDGASEELESENDGDDEEGYRAGAGAAGAGATDASTRDYAETDDEEEESESESDKEGSEEDEDESEECARRRRRRKREADDERGGPAKRPRPTLGPGPRDSLPKGHGRQPDQPPTPRSMGRNSRPASFANVAADARGGAAVRAAASAAEPDPVAIIPEDKDNSSMSPLDFMNLKREWRHLLESKMAEFKDSRESGQLSGAGPLTGLEIGAKTMNCRPAL